MEYIQKVFIHELGHFVAYELNHKYYNDDGVAEMTLHPCEKNNHEICGSFKFINNSTKNNRVPIKRLSEFLAVTIHGCLFQAYFTEKDWNDCMSVNDDIKDWIGAIVNNQQDSRHFVAIENDFFVKLVSEKSLERFSVLKVQDYIKPTFNRIYTIDVEKLRKDIAISLEVYYPIYQELINQYRLKIRYPKA